MADKPERTTAEAEAPQAEPEPLVLDRDAKRAEAEAAAKEPEPTIQAPALPPLVLPRRLVASMRPERVITIKGPDEFSTIELTFWINPSDLEVQAVAKSRPMLTNFLAYFLRSWNLMYEEETDERGNVVRPSEPVPVNNEELGALSADLISWFGDRYREQRLHPLPSASERSLSMVPEPNQIGGGSTGSRNGSG